MRHEVGKYLYITQAKQDLHDMGLSSLLSTILNKASDAMRASTECKSTEEALRAILECNRSISNARYLEKLTDVMVMSMDVKSLYPILVWC